MGSLTESKASSSKHSLQSIPALKIPPFHHETALSPDTPPPCPSPKPLARRIFSDPVLPSPLTQFSSINPTQNKKSTTKSPTTSKNVKFGEQGKSQTMPTGGRGKLGMNRRHSSEAKMNVHTECGRHSDDWLFGGFSMAGVVGMVGKGWGKKAEGKGKKTDTKEEEEGEGEGEGKD